MPFPSCKCDKPKPAIHLETKKSGPNQGRWFYKCKSNKCSFWKWDDNASQEASNDETAHDDTQDTMDASSIPTQRKLSWDTRPISTKRPADAVGPIKDVTFAIHSRSHLALKAPDKRLEPILCSIPDSSWDEKARVWLFPLSLPAYNAATNHLSNTKDFWIRITPLPEPVVHVLAQESGERAEDEKKARRLQAEEMVREKVRPAELLEKLMSFQREGVIEAVARGGRILLGDEMGLGKTIQSLAICSVYSEDWPVLVLCPSSLRLTWRGEITKWLDVSEDEVQVVFTGKEVIGEDMAAKDTKKNNKKKKGRKVNTKKSSKDKGRKSRKKARLLESEDEGSEGDLEAEDEDEGEDEGDEEDEEDEQSREGDNDEKETKNTEKKIKDVRSKKFVVMSYDLASKYEDQLRERNFQLIIADESHFLKSRDTKRTKAVLPLLISARHVLLLSGTPAFSRPAELWTQLHALDHAMFPTFHSFGQRYCAATRNKWGWDYTGSSNLPELNYLLMHTSLIRRLKNEVELELPDKTRQIIYIDVTASAQREVNKLMEKMEELELRIKSRESDGEKDRFEKRKTMLEMYTESGLAKIPAIKQYLSELYENSEKKFLIFAHHTAVMNAITDHLVQKHKAKYIRIDGSTDQRSRQDLCDRFQTEQDVRVAILSITAANVGLTLHAADMVVFAELFWNPSQLMQAEDRAHRIGRKGCVDVKYILAMSTLDGLQWPLIQRKLEVIGQTLDGSRKKVNMEASSISHTEKAISMHDHFTPKPHEEDEEENILSELAMAGGDEQGMEPNGVDSGLMDGLSPAKVNESEEDVEQYVENLKRKASSLSDSDDSDD